VKSFNMPLQALIVLSLLLHSAGAGAQSRGSTSSSQEVYEYSVATLAPPDVTVPPIVLENEALHALLVELLNTIREKLSKRGALPRAAPFSGKPIMPPESCFTADGRITAWVEQLLARAKAGELSKYSSVVVRKVGGRLFARIRGAWFDTSLTQSCEIHLIARDTAASIALLKADERLKNCFELGLCVVVRADATSAVSLGHFGIEKADDARLKKLIGALQKPQRGG